MDRQETEEYEAEFSKTTQNIETRLMETLNDCINKELSSADQIGSIIIAICATIENLSKVIRSSTDEKFTFYTFISRLMKIHKMIEKAKNEITEG